MKHFLHKLMLLAVCLMTSIYANAYDVEVDGIYYNLLSKTDKTVEVTWGDSKHTGDVVIPGKVTIKSEEFAVIGIGQYAFYNDYRVTSVTIPESVTTIGIHAFEGCSGLTSVTIPESVTTIDIYTFYGCWGLTSVTIPESVTSIGYNAFEGCSSLTSVTIGSGVTSIGSSAFGGCSSLTSVIIPEGVTSIGSYAFNNCSGLTSVTIPEGVTSIGNHVFERCSGLTSVTIPESVTTIGMFAFYYCSGLTSVTIPEGVTSIGEDAFAGCSGLTSVTIPEGVTSIGGNAFSSCNLSEIILKNPDVVYDYNSINCGKLCTIYVPAGAKALYEGKRGWADCYDIVELPLDDSKLQEEIKNAEVLLATLKEGASYTIDLSNAIETAKKITAQKDVKNAVQTLQDAEEDAITRSQYPDIAEGHYYLKNVETGMFLEGGNDWGTQASLGHGIDFILASVKGKYSLDSQISNGGNNHYLDSNGYVDGGSTTFVFTEAGDGYTISSGDAVLTASEGSTVVSFAAENGAYSQWRFVTKQERIKELRDRIMRGETNVDATFMIQCPDFGRNDKRISAWGEAGTVPVIGGPSTNMVAEKWGGNSQTFTVKQTINGLPSGTYRLECKGFYRYNNTTSNTNRVAVDMHAAGTELIHSYLYANQVETPLRSIADDEAADVLSSVIGYNGNNCGLPFGLAEAENAFSRGLYDNAITFQVKNGTAVIGITKKQHDGCDWTVFDNFRLYYVSPQPYSISTVTYQISEALSNGSYNVNDIRSTVDSILER